MKILELNFPISDEAEKIYDNGLEPVKMHRLGNLVLLAGKNGSGKSRVLRKMLQIINRIDEVIDYKLNAQHRINDAALDQFDLTLAKLFNYVLPSDKKLSKYSNKILNFVPQNLDLQSWKDLNYSNLLESAEAAEEIGFDKMHLSVLPKIQLLKNIWIATSHPFLINNFSEEQRNLAVNEFDEFNNLIERVLGTKIGVDINNNPTLFGLSIEESNLSQGQKLLLQLCTAIHCQKKNLNELILLLDEPENHIHPSSLIEVVDKIISCVPNGQVWIATHSISLLAHFSLTNIFFLDNGKVSHAGKTPEKILTSLLGSDEEIKRLKDFIDLPEIYALNNFAFECLFHPVSITTRFDNQMLQINQLVKSLIDDFGKIKLLDYGAGKCRFLSNLSEYDKNLSNFVDYVAYDKNEIDKQFCLSLIKDIYNTSDNRYFTDKSELISKHLPCTFNIILLCNVLHEIDPLSWIKLFRKDGYISNLIRDDGYLLIVEDYYMNIGERAYNNGFAILDTREIMLLFDIKDDERKELIINEKREGRLKAHLIPKKFLPRINNETRKSSLQSLQLRAKSEIERIKSIINPNYIEGKLYAFWIHQLANTILILDNITND